MSSKNFGYRAVEDGDIDMEELVETTEAEDSPSSSSWSWGCSCDPQQAMAMISNFSTSYNVVNISLVLPILEDLYPATAEESSASASSLLAGMMVGQVVGGALGDTFLGRVGALRLVMALQVAASIGSALLWKSHLYAGLAIWRFVLGVGAGGVYPLAATLSAETTTTTRSPSQVTPAAATQTEQKLQNVVLTFSMQGVGFLAVPLIAVPLLFLVPESHLDLVWRILLGLGCLPGLVLMVLQWYQYSQRHRRVEMLPQSEDEESTPPPSSSTQIEEEEADGLEVVDRLDGNTGVWVAIRSEPNLCFKMLGTAGTWFLFDVLFYGNTLFEPIVMEAAFDPAGQGSEKSLQKDAVNSLILALIALPGYVVSAFVIGKRVCCIQQTPTYVQTQGFLLMGILYAVIGSLWSTLKTFPALLVFVYGLTFFFANYGPNTTTFILPSLMFSEDCRSTLNGISAASGKAGALCGSILFAPAAETFGSDRVMLLCACVSVVALIMTRCFVRLPLSPTD